MRAWFPAVMTFVFLSVPILLSVELAKAGQAPSSLEVFHVSILSGARIGSGFAIHDGVIVTAAHVVAGKKEGDHVHILSPGEPNPVTSGQLIGISARMDLALIRVPRGAFPVPPRREIPSREKDTVHSVGIAMSTGPYVKKFALGSILRTNARLKPFGRGHFARLERATQGFSGGAVFGSRGRVLGMIVAVKSNKGQPVAFFLSLAEILSETSSILELS